MVKVDYISTTDLNKVAKIHSSKKYFNWIMKIIDNEYRFYPPIIIEDIEDDFDDFDFIEENEDISDLENLLVPKEEKQSIPMFGELWENTTKFFVEEKFKFVSSIESKLDKQSRTIKKGMNCSAKIEQYTDTNMKFSSGNIIKKDKVLSMNTDNESYKLYKIKQSSNCISKINKYKNDKIDEENTTTLNDAFVEKINKIINKTSEIEVLSLDEEFA